MKSVVSIAAVIIMALFFAAGCRTDIVAVRRTEILMGTEVKVVARGTDEKKLARSINEAFSEMSRIEKIMSSYDDTSELSRINAQAGVESFISDEMLQLLLIADIAHSETGGAFDPTIAPVMELWSKLENRLPSVEEIARLRSRVGWEKVKLDPEGKTILLEKGMLLDLDGIAKGFIVDKGLEKLRAGGVASGLVDAGGDVSCFSAASNSPWQVGIRNPHDPAGKPVQVVSIRNGALATSGNYERYWEINGRNYPKIIDPITLFPSKVSSLSASAYAQSAALADAWATAAMVKEDIPAAGDKNEIALMIIFEGRRDFNSRWQMNFGPEASP